VGRSAAAVGCEESFAYRKYCNRGLQCANFDAVKRVAISSQLHWRSSYPMAVA
jgi:hypothetical protein